jgi:hypothetical protein
MRQASKPSIVYTFPTAIVHTIKQLNLDFSVAIQRRRTVETINKQLERRRFVATRQKAFVETIEQAADGLAWWSDGDMLPGRTLRGIVKQFYSKISKVKPSAKVITIEQNLHKMLCH